MLATAGEIGTGDNNSDGEPPVGMPDPPMPGQPMPGEPMPGDGDGSNDEGVPGDPISQQVKGRNMVGLYAELNLHPVPQWEFAFGVRGDLWMTGTMQQHAAEPRVTLTYHPTDVSDIYVAGGVAYQPAVFRFRSRASQTSCSTTGCSARCKRKLAIDVTLVTSCAWRPAFSSVTTPA
jgi:hypothetical protein